MISVLRRFFDKNYYYRSHYSWLIDGTMHGHDVGDLSELLPPQPPPKSDRPLTVLIQKPYEGEAIRRLLTALYIGTRCSDFVEPDNPYIALVCCDLPPAATATPLSLGLSARYWIGTEPDKPPFISRAEPFIAYAMIPAQCYDDRTAGFCYAEWSGTVEVREGDFEFVPEHRGRATLEVTIDGQPISNRKIHLVAGAHAVKAVAKLPRELETGVRLSWRIDGKTELVPFYKLGSDS